MAAEGKSYWSNTSAWGKILQYGGAEMICSFGEGCGAWGRAAEHAAQRLLRVGTPIFVSE